MRIPSTIVAAALALALGTAAASAQTAPAGTPGKPPAGNGGKEAEAPAEGYFNAFACEKIDRPLRVAVELLDNTEDNMRLRDVFVERLSKSGARVEPGAALILSLDIETVREGRIRKPSDLVDVYVGMGGPDPNADPLNRQPDSGSTSIDDSEARVRMNIWSNRRDSVIGGPRRKAEGDVVDQLHVTININSRTDGTCLWRGDAIHNLDGGEPRTIGAALMRYLVAQIGKPASRQPIRLDN
ncbi:MAG: hypothetical protein GEU92_14280 [Alphaproteobacteria bacterium]|nr:hypothetical protein [Alphaproteobacteria bacterium]